MHASISPSKVSYHLLYQPQTGFLQIHIIVVLSCLTMRRELSSLEYSVSHSTQTAPYTHTRRNRLLFAKRQRGSLNCMRGVQTHSRPPVFLVQFRKDQARMNGTPQPNQKWLPALGIELGSLDHKPQPLTIGPFLTSWLIIVVCIIIYCALLYAHNLYIYK